MQRRAKKGTWLQRRPEQRVSGCIIRECITYPECTSTRRTGLFNGRERWDPGWRRRGMVSMGARVGGVVRGVRGKGQVGGSLDKGLHIVENTRHVDS